MPSWAIALFSAISGVLIGHISSRLIQVNEWDKDFYYRVIAEPILNYTDDLLSLMDETINRQLENSQSPKFPPSLLEQMRQKESKARARINLTEGPELEEALARFENKWKDFRKGAIEHNSHPKMYQSREEAKKMAAELAKQLKYQSNNSLFKRVLGDIRTN